MGALYPRSPIPLSFHIVYIPRTTFSFYLFSYFRDTSYAILLSLPVIDLSRYHVE